MIRRTACVLCALTAAAQAQDGVALPTGFDGTYAVEGMTCEDDLGRVTVTDGVMVGAEFAITVTELVEYPGEPDRILASLLNQGGGGEWDDSAELLRQESGLQFTYPDGSRVLWSRCE
jgi:hypothetical protein